MTVDPMARLAAANPVPCLPDVESSERMLRFVEGDGHRNTIGSHPRRRLRVGRALVLAFLAGSVGVASLILTDGSTNPGVNVAAAAYAATSPKSGVVEAVFVAHDHRGDESGATLWQREWIDESGQRRRERNTVIEPLARGGASYVDETVSTPGRLETWSDRKAGDQIRRVRTALDFKVHMAFGGMAMGGIEGIEMFRKLYRKGLMRLAGRERHDGRSLWKLESRPVIYDANGVRRVVNTGLVVLVDPHTFQPVSERLVEHIGHLAPTIVECDLVSYRSLPAAEAGAKLFDLAAWHPGASVVQAPGIFPRYVRLPAAKKTHRAR